MCDRGKFDELILRAEQRAAQEQNMKSDTANTLLRLRKAVASQVQSRIDEVLRKIDIPTNLRLINEQGWNGLGVLTTRWWNHMDIRSYPPDLPSLDPTIRAVWQQMLQASPSNAGYGKVKLGKDEMDCSFQYIRGYQLNYAYEFIAQDWHNPQSDETGPGWLGSPEVFRGESGIITDIDLHKTEITICRREVNTGYSRTRYPDGLPAKTVGEYTPLEGLKLGVVNYEVSQSPNEEFMQILADDYLKQRQAGVLPPQLDARLTSAVTDFRRNLEDRKRRVAEEKTPSSRKKHLGFW